MSAYQVATRQAYDGGDAPTESVGHLQEAGGVTLFEVAPEGRSWLIKHNRGVLGRVGDKAEAIQIAGGLAAWCKAQGRLVSFQPE